MQSDWPVWVRSHSAGEGPACWGPGPAGAAPGHGCSAVGQLGTLVGEASGRAGGWHVSWLDIGTQTEDVFKWCSGSTKLFAFRVNRMAFSEERRGFTNHLIHAHSLYTQRGSRKQAPNGKDFWHLRGFSTLHLKIHKVSLSRFQWIIYTRLLGVKRIRCENAVWYSSQVNSLSI